MNCGRGRAWDSFFFERRRIGGPAELEILVFWFGLGIFCGVGGYEGVVPIKRGRD